MKRTQGIKVYIASDPYDKLVQTIDASGDSISRIINSLIEEHLPDNYINNEDNKDG